MATMYCAVTGKIVLLFIVFFGGFFGLAIGVAIMATKNKKV